MTKRIVMLGLVIIFLITTTFIYSKGQEEEEGITLQFASWMVAEESGGEEWIPERIDVWEKDHPGVNVEVVPIGWEDTPNKITLQIQGGNAPDIFTIESLWLGKFARMADGVVDLNTYMDQEFKSKLVDAYKGGLMGDKMAGLVWNPNPWVLVYNKELIRNAGVSGTPDSLQDFLNQVEAVHSQNSNAFGAGIMLGVDEYSADTFHILLWANDAALLNDNGEPVINSTAAVQTVGMIKDLVDRGVVPFGEEVRNLRTLFAQDRVGFFFEGPWIAGVLDGEGMSRDEWSVAPWPGQVQPASHLLCLSQQSEHKDLAWDLMKFIVTDETTTKEYYKRTGLMPVVKSHYNDPVYDNHYAQTFLDQMERMRNPNVWASPKKYEIEIAFMEGIQKILLGEIGVKAGLNEINDEIKSITAE
jgi:ABC-type glycerol-3-phosphate transport system substrate-binding protein